MRFLMIATGYLPYAFSENLCNGKLVYAMHEAGIEVDVISKVDLGPTYGTEWKQPWNKIQHTCHEIDYPLGNKLTRIADYIRSGIAMDFNFMPSIRWARRAYEMALKLISENHYDAILTRSPNDIAHLVGYKLKKKTDIKWIANWNDPADPIWPGPYKHNLSPKQQQKAENHTAKLLQYADINTFPSDSLRQHFIEHFPFLTTHPTEVIPHIGLHESIFPKKEYKRGDVLRICHSGNMSGERNPRLLFEAMRELIDEGITEFKLDIMGYANDSFNQMIKEYGLDDYVRNIGSFDYLEALERLQDYDVLLLLEAKLEKGIFFASKFTDYAQTGRPIFAVSPAQGFAADMISKHNAGISVVNTDKNDIKNGLRILIENWKSNDLENITSERLFEEFQAEKIIKLYKNIINSIN